MTITISAALENRTCPDCGSSDFRAGPRGGLAQNIECRKCLARFNVTLHLGHLVYAERIERISEGGANWDGMYGGSW